MRETRGNEIGCGVVSRRPATFLPQIRRRKDRIRESRHGLGLWFRAGRLSACGEGTLASHAVARVHSGCTSETTGVTGVQTG